MKQEEMVNYFYSSIAGGQLSRYDKANSGIWWTYSSLKIGDYNKLRCFFTSLHTIKSLRVRWLYYNYGDRDQKWFSLAYTLCWVSLLLIKYK